MGVFGHAPQRTPTGYKAALTSAYADFQSWRRHAKIPCSQKRFNFNGLFNEQYGALLNAKGFNARVLAEWLCDVLRRVRLQEWPQEHGRTLGLCRDLRGDERSYIAEVALNLGCIRTPKAKTQKGHRQFRTGLTRYFGLSERASRFLTLSSTSVDLVSAKVNPTGC